MMRQSKLWEGPSPQHNLNWLGMTPNRQYRIICSSTMTVLGQHGREIPPSWERERAGSYTPLAWMPTSSPAPHAEWSGCCRSSPGLPWPWSHVPWCGYSLRSRKSVPSSPWLPAFINTCKRTLMMLIHPPIHVCPMQGYRDLEPILNRQLFFLLQGAKTEWRAPLLILSFFKSSTICRTCCKFSSQWHYSL